MTLVKFKKPRLPWYDSMFTDLLGSDRLLTNDFMLENKWIPAMNVKETDDHFRRLKTRAINEKLQEKEKEK